MKLKDKEIEDLKLVFEIGIKAISNNINSDNALIVCEKIREIKELEIKLIDKLS
jgi:hypothetical protein